MAFKSTPQSIADPLGLPNPVETGNLGDAWETGGLTSLDQALVSSLIITIGSVVCLIVIGSLCAYAIARRRRRRRSTARASSAPTCASSSRSCARSRARWRSSSGSSSGTTSSSRSRS